jgi:hypothetical protein
MKKFIKFIINTLLDVTILIFNENGNLCFNLILTLVKNYINAKLD